MPKPPKPLPVGTGQAVPPVDPTLCPICVLPRLDFSMYTYCILFSFQDQIFLILLYIYALSMLVQISFLKEQKSPAAVVMPY